MAHILQNTMPEILDGGVNVYQIVLLVVPFQVSFDVHRDPGHQRRGGGDLGIGMVLSNKYFGSVLVGEELQVDGTGDVVGVVGK